MRIETIFVMATIFSSSGTAPLNSVINYCTAATILNILLSRGKTICIWGSTDCPACCSCWCKGTGTLGSIVAGPATATWHVSGRCCCSVLPRSAAAKKTSGVARSENNTLRIVVLGVLCDFLFCISSSAYLQPR
jgi:hypothetical protein